MTVFALPILPELTEHVDAIFSLGQSSARFNGAEGAMFLSRDRIILAALLLAALLSTQSTAMEQVSLTPAEMREDLAVFLADWLPKNDAFSAEQKAQSEAIVQDALANVENLTPADFALEISRALAVGRVGHSTAFPGIDAFFNILPVGAWWFADGFYIVRAHPDYKNLLGARIEKIGPFTPEEALARLAPYVSGTDERIKALSARYLTMIEKLDRIGAAQENGNVLLSLRLPNGETQATELGAAPNRDTGLGRFGTNSIPTPAPSNVDERWSHVLDTLPTVPLAYRPLENVSFEWIGEGENIFYLRSNMIGSLNETPMVDVLLFPVLHVEIAAKMPKNVIIDLRLNNGGNFFNTLLFAQALPKLIPDDGRIFVLVDNTTFSAAIVTAALLKGHGHGKTILIGDTMGDSEHFWAEGALVTLPNSGIELLYNTGLHDWVTGCSDHPSCYWVVNVFGVTNDTLEPDYRVIPTFADYVAGRDPVLERALSLGE